ncbi:uncharacterized protein LOC127438840 [Myxocyprinus asiaticus]|uniref:uncharacterized protein LOC127438840 n=1 Tax=Myxocyprinus asiaticus TaxID=70543 RepID=UPI002223B215|nr:uncharacterized protein LOC127438840 [Myxocyprinus asiaticus]
MVLMGHSEFHQTGSLTITDTGLYQLKISGRKSPSKTFNVTIYAVFGKMKSVSVMEGKSVTLHTDLTEVQINDVIEWMFGPEETLIASIRKRDRIFFTYDVDDVRFKDRLQVNNETGSLTVTNITTEHSGLYQLDIIRWGVGIITHRFNVTVYACLPIPVITSYCPQNPSSSESSSKCVLVCSVVNVTHCGNVTLSWYKGNSLFSSISVSDLNSSLSLPLEVEYQENNIYSCVVSNPIRNQTKHLNITEVCQPCSDWVRSCDSTEAAMRLVVSALMGVAAVAAIVVLVYDIRSRRLE